MPSTLLVAFIVCSVIGLPSYKARIVDMSGLLSGYVMGMGTIYFGGWNAFILILTFFIFSGMATKYHYDQKKKRGVAELKGGARGYKNVFGNGMVALVFAVLEFTLGGGAFIAGYLGAVAAATSDTAGGEIGRLSKEYPRLITNFKKVPTGTEGAISLLGESAELLICIIIGMIAWTVGFSSSDFSGANIVLITTISGFIGAHVDSYLGATLETSKEWFGNNHTNFFCTLAGAISAMALYYIFI
ncbi:MAG: TIGR00297 family protein [Candidatus Methanofastidiosia archaeon]